jgi:3-oxoacyl-[acyl-carrier protein] reductase
MRLKNKVALVTGSSRGVGRAVALGFAQQGANVAINYTSNENAANEAVDAIQAMGSKAIAVKADVAQKTGAEGLVRATVETFGKIDILVNNAGFTRPALLLKMTEEEWDQVVDIHLKGAFLCSQAAGLHMKAQNSGKIINVMSVA